MNFSPEAVSLDSAELSELLSSELLPASEETSLLELAPLSLELPVSLPQAAKEIGQHLSFDSNCIIMWNIRQ